MYDKSPLLICGASALAQYASVHHEFSVVSLVSFNKSAFPHFTWSKYPKTESRETPWASLFTIPRAQIALLEPTGDLGNVTCLLNMRQP